MRDRGALDINDLFRKPELAGQDNGDGGVVLGTGLILAVGEGEDPLGQVDRRNRGVDGGFRSRMGDDWSVIGRSRRC